MFGKTLLFFKLTKAHVYLYNSVVKIFILVPVAQLDRASDSDSEGQRFKSSRVHQQKENFCLSKVLFLFIQAAGLAYHSRTQYGAYHQKQTSACFLHLITR